MDTDKSGLIEESTTESVIGAFFAVYSELGHGFLEQVYENAMAIALRQQGLPVLQQAALDVLFRGFRVGEYRADLLVPGKLIIEVKATTAITGAHEAQLLNYLKATGIRVGLLLNFGPKPQFKRPVN
jgi:GxxExxY protein